MYKKTDNSFRLASDREVMEMTKSFFENTLVKEQDTDLFWRTIQLRYFQAVYLLVKHTASPGEQNFNKVFELIVLGNDEIDNLFAKLDEKEPADDAVIFYYGNVRREASRIPGQSVTAWFMERMSAAESAC